MKDIALRRKLEELLEYLEGAQQRAEQAADEMIQRYPKADRYPYEAGTLLATCDHAAKKLQAIINTLL